jgi:RsiW-degrading membrane proteinase PrsW (M82 family)
LAVGFSRVIRFGSHKVNRGAELEKTIPLLGLLPGLIWLAYSRWRRGYQPRSFENLVRVFIWGCACTIPAFVIENTTGAVLGHKDLVHAAVSSFLLIAPTEELFKLVAVWVAIYRSQDFREPLDGMVYAATAALGFVSVENLIFMSQLGPESIVPRAVYATPAHVLFASMWGYSMGVARFQRRGEMLTILKGYLLAVGFHGTYDMIVAINPKAAMFSVLPLMIFMAWLAWRNLRSFRQHRLFPSLGKGALICCPTCGAYELETSTECSRCGTAIPMVDIDIQRFCGQCRAPLDLSSTVCHRCGQPVSLREPSDLQAAPNLDY